MNPAQALEDRITELEIKSTWAEDMVEQLNQVIVRQQRQIDLLIREIGLLKAQVPEAGAGGAPHLRDELPPHY